VVQSLSSTLFFSPLYTVWSILRIFLSRFYILAIDPRASCRYVCCFFVSAPECLLYTVLNLFKLNVPRHVTPPSEPPCCCVLSRFVLPSIPFF